VDLDHVKFEDSKSNRIGMTYILYGGLKYYQVRHAIFCKLCKDTLESKDIYDFKMCSCRSVGIDGGLAENRIIGDRDNYENRSMYVARVNGKKYWLPEN
jgi:hypothetical protein